MMERYLKIVRRRKITALLFILFGIIVLTVLLITKGSIVPDYMRTFFACTGVAWIFNGSFNFYRNGKLLRSSEAVKKAAIIEFDERAAEVMRRSCSMTLYLLLIFIYIAVIIASFISRSVCYTLLVSLCAGLVLWFICYTVVWKTI